ncbi:hypothetical protein AHAS_Ahas13G0231300 [Arachis hypogaea]
MFQATGLEQQNKLCSWLPEDVVKKIAAITLQSPWRKPDHVAWMLSLDGSFNLKQSYQALCHALPPSNRILNLVRENDATFQPHRLSLDAIVIAKRSFICLETVILRQEFGTPCCHQCGNKVSLTQIFRTG